MMLFYMVFSTAWPWECIPYNQLMHPSENHAARNMCQPVECRHPPGNAETYHFVAGDFLSADKNVIEDGIDAWTAGPGAPIRDANFTFARGGDVSTRSFNDSANTVSSEPGTWFIDAGISANILAISITTITTWPGCNWRATDVVFNEWATWSNNLPNNIAESSSTQAASRGYVAMHEFGHSFGLAHIDASSPQVINVMNKFGTPGAGDAAGKYRIQEDEARAVVAIKGNGQSHVNLMLSRFIADGFQSGGIVGEDEWRNGTATNGVHVGDRLDSFGSNEISGDQFKGTLTASITGNVPSATTKVQWVWRPVGANWPCRNPPASHVLATLFPTVNNNFPFQFGPPINLVVPFASPGTRFRVCAVIDPWNQIQETQENDNVIFTEHSYIIL